MTILPDIQDRLTDTGFPPTFLNKYILSELEYYGLISDIDLINPTPMIPAQVSTNIEDLYNDSIQIRQAESPILIVYDRLMRFRPTSFYLHKREQLIYFIYSTDVGKLIDTVRVISSALDREDSSAKDVNAYNFMNPTLTISSPPITYSAKTISNKALTNKFATITTSTAHNLEVGDAVEITGLDATFNGIHYVRDKTATTFKFKKDAANVASIAASEQLSPMIPAIIPTNIEDLYNDRIEIRQTPDPILIVYDRLMRFRPTPFYLQKREQLIYFIYSTDVGKLIDTVRVISNALDREDSSAEDVNRYNINNPILDANADISTPFNVMFHSTRVYQADESRDVAELASARTLFVNKLIVEYDYHVSVGSDSRYT